MGGRCGLLVICMALISAACGSSAGAPLGSVETSAAPSTGAKLSFPADLPVDPSLTPVSRSSPTLDAKAAIALCLGDSSLDQVAGMAQLPGNEVRRFMFTNGKEPSLQTDDLVWAIQLKTSLTVLVGPPVVDPLCVVIGGTRTFYAPYGTVAGAFSPPPDFVWPISALPPLAP